MTVPFWCWWLLAVVLVGGGQQLRVNWAQADAAASRTDLASYRLEVSERDRRTDAQARAEEQRRQRAADEVEKDAKGKLEVARTDAAAAERAADGLRREVVRLRAGREATCGAIAAQQRQAGDAAFDLLAELFESADRRAGELAAALDRSRVAGQACEAAYDRVGVPGAG
ncbi:hypothetical protein D3C80_1545100 [compost metagenome]